MNKKFYGTLLLGTLLLGSTIVSCKDYDDDIDNLQNQITQLATKADMQSEVSKLQSAVATAQAAAENKAAAAEQAAKDAAAKAQAAADAAAKAQGSADAAATVEALNKVAADAAAAAKAAEEAKAAAEAKAAELEAQLAELQALAATLVSTEDFEAAKKELNDKYAELAAKIGETTGTTGMTGLSIVGLDPAKTTINSGYGVWDGVHKGANAATWSGSRALPTKGDYVVEFGKPSLKIAVNPTDLDLSNTEFAVVNQFGDVAPIAFGTPTVPTRALSAGVYELKYTSAALTSESVQAFSKSFADEKGGTATLVAGNIAAQVTKNFVAITKIKNGDNSKFYTEVAYDEIANGTVELKAVDAQYVYDSYIEKLDGTTAHDSLMWKLVYSGKDMTLAYNAAAIKKAVDANNGNDLTIKLQVKQINLNGYIHTTKGDDAKIVFKAKAAAEDVVKEPVQIEEVPHTIAVNVLDKATGKYPNAQKVTVDLKEAIEAWGLDDKKSDDYIHWSHGSIDKSFGTAYYYNDNNDTVQVTGLVSTVELNDDKNILTINFTEDYKYTGWDKVVGDLSKDVVFSGKTVYIPVALTLVDNTDQESNTIYNVVVPVKFASPDLKQYYAWGANGEQTIKVPNVATGALSATLWQYLLPIDDINYVNAKSSNGTVAPAVTLVWPYGTEYDADGNAKTPSSPASFVTKYIVPSVNLTAPNFNAIPEYKKEVERINALIDGSDTNDAGTYYGETYEKVNDNYKTALKNTLKKEYNNYVLFAYTSNYVRYGEPITEVKSDKFFWSSVYNATNPIDAVPASTANPHIIFHDIDDVNVKKALWNSTYTLSGFKAKFAGREIPQSVQIELTYNPAPSAALTISNNEYINEANAPALLFSNSKIAVKGTDAAKFDRTFTAVDKFESALYLDSALVKTEFSTGTPIPAEVNITSNVKFEVVTADGVVHPTTTTATGSITVTSVLPKVFVIQYAIDDKSHTALGLKVKPDASNKMTYTVGVNTEEEVKSGDKIRVTINKGNTNGIWKRLSDDAEVNEAFTFELEVK